MVPVPVSVLYFGSVPVWARSITSLAGYVGDMLATRRRGSKCRQIWADVHVGADTKSTPTQEFCVWNHQQIVDTVVCTDTVICTYCSTCLPQGVVAIQQFPPNSATIILDNATFAITIEPVCVVVIAIRAALLLRNANNALGSYVVRYYFLIVTLPLLSQLLFSALHHKHQWIRLCLARCVQQTGRGHMKQKHWHWYLKLLYHDPHNQQPPHSSLREEEGVEKREKMV